MENIWKRSLKLVIQDLTRYFVVSGPKKFCINGNMFLSYSFFVLLPHPKVSKPTLLRVFTTLDGLYGPTITLNGTSKRTRLSVCQGWDKTLSRWDPLFRLRRLVVDVLSGTVTPVLLRVSIKEGCRRTEEAIPQRILFSLQLTEKWRSYEKYTNRTEFTIEK